MNGRYPISEVGAYIKHGKKGMVAESVQAAKEPKNKKDSERDGG